MRVAAAEARQRWVEAYDAGGAAPGSGAFRLGARKRHMLILTGLVLPVWEVVEAALARQSRAADRRLRVLRIQTTGASRCCEEHKGTAIWGGGVPARPAQSRLW
jgi:hypothetical protein